jgi:16S rRNA (guanine527-N7)-methyltransferase
MSPIEQQIAAYLTLLAKWNDAYNLTAISDPERMMTHHILDSLAVAPFLYGQKILDVGSGAGLPGIPLALVHPDQQFFLLDSNGKKTRFLLHVVHTLNLKNVQVIQDRVEDYQPAFCFDSILARAFSSLRELVHKAQHLCCPTGKILAMKGAYPTAELAELGSEFTTTTHRLEVPGLNAERHLICVTAKKEAPKKSPPTEGI